MANNGEATAVSFRKGTKAEHEVFRGVKGEVTVDTTDKTVWVHLGDGEMGTPLARGDLVNVNINASSVDTVRQNLSLLNYTDINLAGVTQETIANKGIAKTDMSNVSSSVLAEGREHPLAYADTTNINTADLVDPLIHTGGVSGNKPLAYKDLSNVTAQDFHTALDSIYAKIDMSNMATSSLAENRPNPLAYANLSNLDLSQASDLQNVYTQGLQLTSNLTTTLSSADHTHYPSALTVKNALDAIGALPELPVKSATSSLLLMGMYHYEYRLTLNNGGTNYVVGDILLLTDNALHVSVTQVDANGTITSAGYTQLDYFGNTEFVETAAAATGGSGTGATFDIASTPIPGYTNNIIWSNDFNSANISYTNSDHYIPENPTIGTIHNVSDALDTLGLNQQKPQISDIVVTDVTGVITVTFTNTPSSVTIKKLVGGTAIAGTWSSASTTMTFTPTTATDVLNESWIIKPQ